jgi:hypothetical protein
LQENQPKTEKINRQLHLVEAVHCRLNSYGQHNTKTLQAEKLCRLNTEIELGKGLETSKCNKELQSTTFKTEKLCRLNTEIEARELLEISKRNNHMEYRWNPHGKNQNVAYRWKLNIEANQPHVITITIQFAFINIRF